MNTYININDIKVDANCRKKLIKLYEFYRNHEFNLLGSGWKKNSYNMSTIGFEGKKYYSKSMVIYKKIAYKKLKNRSINDYTPINWFIDYRSGFFFNPLKYSSMKSCYTVFDKKEGVDIKCPWELARFYHLVQLAMLATAENKLQDKIIVEYKNELIDFIEMNPVGKTVHWTSSMEIAIRIVNVLVSYDILLQLDKSHYFDKTFNDLLTKHIEVSLKYIMNNLEFFGKTSTNHYLANLVGVIYASAYLPETTWTNLCLVYGIQELIDQFDNQFYEEGTNFEGSTCYHRFSTELVLFATALTYGILDTNRKAVFEKYDMGIIKGLKNPKLQKYNMSSSEFFPKWYIDRLCNAGMFIKIIQKDNNEIIQVGDNDSGRLMKLTPIINLSDSYFEENDLDCRTILAEMSAMYENKEFIQYRSTFPLEYSIIGALSKNRKLAGEIILPKIENYGKKENYEKEYSIKRENIIFSSNEENVFEKMNMYYYKDFGLIVCRNERVFFSIVIDTAKNVFCMGHTHNDKLSIELMVDRKYITRDPGSYIYSASKKMRDMFRSVKAHNTICIDNIEQNEFKGIWEINKKSKAQLIYLSKDEIYAKIYYNTEECGRQIIFNKNEILVNDYANRHFTSKFKNKKYSDGYGKIKRVRK